MARRKLGISTDLIIHPGETISDILIDRNITRSELSQKAGISEHYLNSIIKGKRNISKNTAIGLERALGVSRTFWLNLQANYNEELRSARQNKNYYGNYHKPRTNPLTCIFRHVKTFATKLSFTL